MANITCDIEQTKTDSVKRGGRRLVRQTRRDIFTKLQEQYSPLGVRVPRADR